MVNRTLVAIVLPIVALIILAAAIFAIIVCCCCKKKSLKNERNLGVPFAVPENDDVPLLKPSLEPSLEGKTEDLPDGDLPEDKKEDLPDADGKQMHNGKAIQTYIAIRQEGKMGSDGKEEKYWYYSEKDIEDYTKIFNEFYDNILPNLEKEFTKFDVASSDISKTLKAGWNRWDMEESRVMLNDTGTHGKMQTKLLYMCNGTFALSNKIIPTFVNYTSPGIKRYLAGVRKCIIEVAEKAKGDEELLGMVNGLLKHIGVDVDPSVGIKETVESFMDGLDDCIDKKQITFRKYLLKPGRNMCPSEVFKVCFAFGHDVLKLRTYEDIEDKEVEWESEKDFYYESKNYYKRPSTDAVKSGESEGVKSSVPLVGDRT